MKFTVLKINRLPLYIPSDKVGVVSIDNNQSVLITVNKGECTLNVGGMTPDNELLDYYYSMLSVGDNISISLKNLTQISKPICKRPSNGCDIKNDYH